MTNEEIKAVKMAWAAGEEIQYSNRQNEWQYWNHSHFIDISAARMWRIKPKTIRIGDYDVPVPLREVVHGQDVFYVDITTDDFVLKTTVGVPSSWDFWLSLGIVHSTYENALLHAKALLSFTEKK